MEPCDSYMRNTVDKELKTQKFLSKVLLVCSNYHPEDDSFYFENDKSVSGVLVCSPVECNANPI